ncbi:MAG: P-II family nitrogen regulator [Deltaproteobacteria bacterium]|nr:P-II family nitrogen regulator [Deltaproteobacteria bacterium]
MCTEQKRKLLIAMIKGHRRLESVLEGFLELGLPGATVFDAKGMGQIVSLELPIFSGFRSMFPGGGEETYVLMSVLLKEQVDEAASLVSEVCGDFGEKGTGILFTLPVIDFMGPGTTQ